MSSSSTLIGRETLAFERILFVLKEYKVGANEEESVAKSIEADCLTRCQDTNSYIQIVIERLNEIRESVKKSIEEYNTTNSTNALEEEKKEEKQNKESYLQKCLKQDPLAKHTNLEVQINNKKSIFKVTEDQRSEIEYLSSLHLAKVIYEQTGKIMQALGIFICKKCQIVSLPKLAQLRSLDEGGDCVVRCRQCGDVWLVRS